MRFSLKSVVLITSILTLTACSNYSAIRYKGQLNDPIMVMALLSEQQNEWQGTPYVVGGQTRHGVDCSGFVQTTFMDRFNISLPRMGILLIKTKFKRVIWFSLRQGVD